MTATQPARVEFPEGLSKTERRHLARLIKRRDWLNERIERSAAPLSFDVTEAAALSWAIRQLTESRRP